MRKTILIGCVVLASCASPMLWRAAAQVQQQPATQPSAAGQTRVPELLIIRQWEYSVQSRNELGKLGNSDVSAGMNKLGEDGWELVGIATPAQSGATRGVGSATEYYFKRSKVSRVEQAGMSGLGGAIDQSGRGSRAGVRRIEPEADKGIFQVIRLKNAEAAPTARILNELVGSGTPSGFGGQRTSQSLRIVNDDRTNSILVRASAEQIAAIKELLDQLDRPVDQKEPKRH
jgi:hypothetical protein